MKVRIMQNNYIFHQKQKQMKLNYLQIQNHIQIMEVKKALIDFQEFVDHPKYIFVDPKTKPIDERRQLMELIEKSSKDYSRYILRMPRDFIDASDLLIVINSLCYENPEFFHEVRRYLD